MKIFSFSAIYFSNSALTSGLNVVRNDIRLYNIVTRIKETSLVNRSFIDHLTIKNFVPKSKESVNLNFNKMMEDTYRASEITTSASLARHIHSITGRIKFLQEREVAFLDNVGTSIKADENLEKEILIIRQLETELRDELFKLQNSLREHSDIAIEKIYQKKNNPLYAYIFISLIFVIGILYIGLSTTKNLQLSINNFLVATKAVSQNNLDFQARIIFNDEIGQMTEAFNTMIKNLKEEKFKVSNIGKEKSLLENEIQTRKDAELALESANKELESFSYSVSHDLRTPLRAIDGFSQALLEDYEDKLDDTGKNYLQFVRESSQKMSQLIDDILSLSRITRGELKRKVVNISDIAQSVADELQKAEPNKNVNIVIQPEIIDNVDPHLLRIVLANLIGNSWKFTSKISNPRIEFGYQLQETRRIYFVRDNGAGFDMSYSKKLFGAFQRLHAVTEFPGTGIGLATVSRIIHRHNGTIWAEGEVGKGATFYFTLG